MEKKKSTQVECDNDNDDGRPPSDGRAKKAHPKPSQDWNEYIAIQRREEKSLARLLVYFDFD